MALMHDKNILVEAAVAEMDIDDPYVFDDYFPSMIESSGYDGLMKELCNGFSLLMDATTGLITFESLKRSAFILGLHELGDEEIICMLTEGDMDGDGSLNQEEFCILMLRLNSGLSTYNPPPPLCHDVSNLTASNMWVDDIGINEWHQYASSLI